MRRGQFEIMGIAILIVILIIGVTAILAMSGGDRASYVEVFEREQLAQGAVDAFLRTDVGPDCAGYTYYDLVRDWAFVGVNPCANPTSDSQAFIQAGVRNILDETTGGGYRFRIERLDGAGRALNPPRTITVDARCPNLPANIDRPGQQTIRLVPLPDSVEVTLILCTPEVV